MSSTYSRRVINPWEWQESIGFVWGVEVTGGRTLYLSGGCSIADNKEINHVGDIHGQVTESLDNVETMLDQAGMTWQHMVRFNWYIKGSAIDEFWEKAHPELKERLDRVGCRATCCLIGVERLAHPDMLCEFEGTAVAPVES